MRIKSFCVLLLALLIILTGCSSKTGNSNTPSVQTPGSAVPSELFNAFYPAEHRIGFIIKKSADFSMHIAEYGFLRAAEDLGYPAILYEAESAEASVSLVEQAKQKGCEAVAIWANGAGFDASIAKAKELGMKVIVPYYKNESKNVDVNLLVDDTGYVSDAVSIVMNKLQSSGKSTGSVLLYGDDAAKADLFKSAINSKYPSYAVTPMNKISGDETTIVIPALKDKLKSQKDIVSVFCLENEGANAWAEANKQAENELKASMSTPTPKKATPKVTATPKPTLAPGTTASPKPTATPAPWKISPIILCMNYTETNLSLLSSNAVFALVAFPYYDVSAQAVTVLDKMFRASEPAMDLTKIYVPIITKNNLPKYQGIISQVKEHFGLTSLN